MNYWASWSDSWQKWCRMTHRWGSKATVVMVNVERTVFSHQRGCRSVFILVAWVKFMAQIYEPLFLIIYWHLKFYLLKLASYRSKPIGCFLFVQWTKQRKDSASIHFLLLIWVWAVGQAVKAVKAAPPPPPSRTSLSQDPHRGTPSHFPLWNNQVINLLIL